MAVSSAQRGAQIGRELELISYPDGYEKASKHITQFWKALPTHREKAEEHLGTAQAIYLRIKDSKTSGQLRLERLAHDITFCSSCFLETVEKVRKFAQHFLLEEKLRGVTSAEAREGVFALYKQVGPRFVFAACEDDMPLYDPRVFGHHARQERIAGLRSTITITGLDQFKLSYMCDNIRPHIPSDGSCTFDDVSLEIAALGQALGKELNVFRRYLAETTGTYVEKPNPKTPITHPYIFLACVKTEIYLALTDKRAGSDAYLKLLIKNPNLPWIKELPSKVATLWELMAKMPHLRQSIEQVCDEIFPPPKKKEACAIL